MSQIYDYQAWGQLTIKWCRDWRGGQEYEYTESRYAAVFPGDCHISGGLHLRSEPVLR
jgi:hypothetical protein